MSGQPYNTPLDMAKAREAYLANLQLRAELDDKNLQANKVYVRTGQLPVEQTDTRTLTEKLADVERLKIEIRSKLQEITDGEQAGKIVESLSPDQLVFLSQNFNPIKEQMKRNYALGVPAEAFVDYLIRYIEKFNLTKGVELGLQQSSARELLANQRLILSQMASKRDVIEINDYITKLGVENSNLGKAIKVNLDQLQEVIDYLPETFTELNKADNAIQKAQILELLNNIVRELPTKQDLAQSLSMLERMRSVRDNAGLIAVLQRLEELTASGADIGEQVALLRKLIDENKPVDTPSTIDAGRGEAVVYNQDQTAVQNLYRRFDHPTLNTIASLKEYITTRYPLIEGETGMTRNQFIRSVAGRDYSALNKEQAQNVVKSLNDRLRILGWGEPNPVGVGKGMKGKGIVRVRPSQVFSSDIDYTKGIQPSAKFVPIGRYLINKRQLDKDIIAIKRPAGSTIPSLPSQRVSRNFGNVMRKVVGGGLPTYDELSNLTDDERVYLHKVAKETRIDDKLSIPTPKKDEDERDINQFEILKGQILSGNDNIELVKKFKTILLKLSRKDLIPKAQVKDLLLDLATLGH